MKAGDEIRKTKRRKTLCLIIFLMAAVGGAVVFAAKAAEHTGMYWIGLDSEFVTERPEDNRGFFTVDVSDFLNNTGVAQADAAEEETEVVPLAIGPLPSIPTLTDEELKLYGILSKNDGRISSSESLPKAGCSALINSAFSCPSSSSLVYSRSTFPHTFV